MEEWNHAIIATMKKGFLELDKLTPAEQDTLFALQIGADFRRISIGSQALTSQKQLITVLGFSEIDITNEVSAENLNKHSL